MKDGELLSLDGCELGDRIPYELMGWNGITEERLAFEQLEASGLVLQWEDVEKQVKTEAERASQKPIWDFERQVLSDLLPTQFQQTGDCVACGLKNAGERRQIWEIAQQYQEEKFRPWFAPYIYGTSRNQVGGGMSGAGSVGAWAAKAVARYGVLFSDEEGVPDYSGNVANSWGSRRSGVPSKWLEVAKPFYASTVRLRTTEAIRLCIKAGRFCTIASSRGFRKQPKVYKGFHTFIPSGSWAHQMALVGEMSDPFDAFYRLNTWGPNAHGKPLNNETPGGAWNMEEDLAKEIQGRHVEVYAYFNFQGQPGPVDPGIL